MEHIGTQEIISNRLILRKFSQNDSKEIFNGFRNQKEFLYYTNKKSVTIEEQIDSLKDINEKYKNKDYYNWLIILKDTNQIIGAINLNVNLRNDSVMFNYAIDNRFTGNGYMTEALESVKNFAFNQMKVHRFEGGCVITNIASRRVMEKCGLKFEGTLKDYVKLSDGYHDMYMFAVINKKS